MVIKVVPLDIGLPFSVNLTLDLHEVRIKKHLVDVGIAHQLDLHAILGEGGGLLCHPIKGKDIQALIREQAQDLPLCLIQSQLLIPVVDGSAIYLTQICAVLAIGVIMFGRHLHLISTVELDTVTKHLPRIILLHLDEDLILEVRLTLT